LFFSGQAAAWIDPAHLHLDEKSYIIQELLVNYPIMDVWSSSSMELELHGARNWKFKFFDSKHFIFLNNNNMI
jgi:hypothetical protein